MAPAPLAAPGQGEALAQAASQLAKPAILCCSAACIVYVSEGRDAAALQHLEGVAREAAEAVALASLFVDEPYHRSNFCLVRGQWVPPFSNSFSRRHSLVCNCSWFAAWLRSRLHWAWPH